MGGKQVTMYEQFGEETRDIESDGLVHMEQPFASLYQECVYFGACGVMGYNVTTTRDLTKVTCDDCKVTQDYQYFMKHKNGQFDLSGQ